MDLSNDIELWINNTEQALIQNYKNKKFKASGNWERSLNSTYKQEPSKINIQIEAAHYSYFMEKGRGKTQGGSAGAGGLKAIILQWLIDKAIMPREPKVKRESLAFVIARKIHNEGVKISPEKKNVISGVLTDDCLNPLLESLKTATIKEIKKELVWR